jgi:hypothetical protein
MKSYVVALCSLALTGGAGAAALSACATGAETDQITNPGFTSSSGGGSTSSSSTSSSGSSDDATTSSGSSSGYSDDTSNPNPGDDASPVPSDDSGDDSSGGSVPGPTCTTTQGCVDAIPSGWNGFVQLLVPTTDAGPGCAAPYDTVQPSIGGQMNPDGGPAGCGTCNCFVPDAGVSCSVGLGINNLGCLPPTGGPTTVANANTCVSNPSLPTGQVTTPTPSGGTCAPGPISVTTPPPPPSSTTAVACAESGDGGAAGAAGDGGAAPTGTTCNPGQACADLPTTADAGTPSGVCIYQAGIQTCPPNGTSVFTNTFVVGGVEDTRGCGCACGDLACPGDGYVAGYASTDCSGASNITIDAGAPCKGSLSQKSFKYIPSRTGVAGICGVADAGPTGGVDIDGGSATTFCCVP